VMAENLDLVRSIYAAERGDYSSAEWAHPEVEVVGADGPHDDLRTEAQGYRELDDARVLVYVHNSGRARGSGIEVGQLMGTRAANPFVIREGKVVKIVLYWDRDRALADLGLAE
jgi:hypothetical protein